MEPDQWIPMQQWPISGAFSNEAAAYQSTQIKRLT